LRGHGANPGRLAATGPHGLKGFGTGFRDGQITINHVVSPFSSHASRTGDGANSRTVFSGGRFRRGFFQVFRHFFTPKNSVRISRDGNNYIV